MYPHASGRMQFFVLHGYAAMCIDTEGNIFSILMPDESVVM